MSVDNARAPAPGTPIYAYFHPLYVGGGQLPTDTWSFSMNLVTEVADGTDVREPSADIPLGIVFREP
jgi:hypothetical protein